jgi:hypothetical protein
MRMRITMKLVTTMNHLGKEDYMNTVSFDIINGDMRNVFETTKEAVKVDLDIILKDIDTQLIPKEVLLSLIKDSIDLIEFVEV